MKFVVNSSGSQGQGGADNVERRESSSQAPIDSNSLSIGSVMASSSSEPVAPRINNDVQLRR